MSIQDQIKKSLSQHQLNTRSAVAYLVFGAIILVFVLFGLPGQRTTIGQGIVAEVNGQLISGAELKEETNQLERFYSQMFGGGLNMQMQQQMIQSQALENLITREILAQEATKAGILVSDKEVREFIVEIPAFQEQGRFDKTKYFQYLEAVHSSPEEFEAKIRKEAQRMRVKRIFDSMELGSTLQVAKDAELNSVKLNVQFAKLDRELLAKGIPVSAAQIESYLKNSDNMKKIEVDYETHKQDLYSSPEQVDAQHILIKAKEGDVESEKKALTRITDLKVRATKEDFAALAKSFSEDEGSKAKGGALGFFSRGQMVPAFESAAFNAKSGDIVGPVKTNFGYHLIKVLEKKTAKVRVLDEVKVEIARRLIAETQLDEQFQKLEEALQAKKETDVDAQLKSWSVSWDETGDFDLQTESIPKLYGGESLKEAVWSLGQNGQMLDHLIREGSVRYVLKMKEIKKVEAAKTSDKKLAQLGAGGLFEGWLENIRENNKVIRNDQTLKE